MVEFIPDASFFSPRPYQTWRGTGRETLCRRSFKLQYLQSVAKLKRTAKSKRAPDESTGRKTLYRLLESSTVLATTAGLFAFGQDLLKLSHHVGWLGDPALLDYLFLILLGAIGSWVGYSAVRPRRDGPKR